MTVSLYTSTLASVAHEAVFLPWLRRAAAVAPASRDSVAVLVPQRSDAYHLKALALASGLGLWGVHFLTPSDLRDRLTGHLGLTRRIPLREHLRLLLATAAERLTDGGEERAVNAIAVAPDELLKAIDMIGAAGWEFGEAGPKWLRPVVREFHRLLGQAGWQMMHQADRDALDAAKNAPPCFAELLIIGFNALHWPHWPLLETATRLAGQSVVCLTEPRPGSEDLDAAWIGTWENTFEAAQPIAADRTPPLAEALSVPESSTARARREAAPCTQIEFLAATDTDDHARAIVAKTLQYLADPACGRLGVLFPGAGALSRRIATLLADLGVPHYDGLAHHLPGPLEDAAWPAWLALQESPRVPSLLAFLEIRPGAPFGALTAHDAASELQRAAQELLIDDLGTIAEYLRMDSREKARALAEAVGELPLLPDRAPLREYLARSAEIFRSYAWTARAEALESYAEDWRLSEALPISRGGWLRWLQETLVSWETRRAEFGSHPYSQLHLLPYIHAESQSWTHLIAAGLNEGQWPPTIEESGFLDEEEIAALNGQVRTLNERAAVQGRQGEGHVAVRPGKTLCLGPAQRRALVGRQFLNTLESATVALAATVQLRDEAAPERPLNPSEFFTGLHFAARGRAVSQQTLDALQRDTDGWLSEVRVWPTTPSERTAVASTRAAFDARRAPDRAFGEYEFALRDTPPRPLRLTATDWERALSSPAPIFLRVVLGVDPQTRDEDMPWTRTQGIWVHRWLSALAAPGDSPGLTPLLQPTELRQRARAAAETFRSRVAEALTVEGRAVPDWWQSTWEQARAATVALADSVAAAPGRTHAATEWRIEDTGLPLEGSTLYVRGRIDLLLSKSGTCENVWLVDYKTGRRKPPRTKDRDKGPGLQLTLYALALQAAGAREIGVSLLTPGAPLDEPQYTVTDLAGLMQESPVLLRMQETGAFGMLGALRDEFGYSQDYPLATLPIDPEILDQKWLKTHPEFALPEDES